MKISFNPEATEALARIGRHYLAFNELAAANVEADVRATVERIRRQPLLYAPINRGETRRAITRRYRYLIFKIVDATLIDIVSIRHGAQRPRSAPERD